MLKDYHSTLQYLYENLPMFQRVGVAALKNDLTNTIALCTSLENPQERYRTIHVAGTNGKGSTSHMIASVCQSAGYRTGLYTSPHLKSFTERIRVNGVEISPEFVVTFVNRMISEIERVKPSFFEITVAMAFEYFAVCQVDVAVIEVGLGGRLDSTNVINPVVSVITNIGWDHMSLLGDTLEKIASEKAGIIKPNVPVVVSERQPGVEHVFREHASRKGSDLHFGSDHYQVMEKENLLDIHRQGKKLTQVNLPLKGFYQQKNVVGVMMAVEVLNQQGFDLPLDKVVHGLAHVVDQTGLKGRWQTLGQLPLVVCDTGHNLDGVREVLKQLQAQKFDRLHMVWGMVNDKDITTILKLLPKNARYYFCQADIPRAMDANALATAAYGEGLEGSVFRNVKDAIAAAKAGASKDDMIFIGGSTFVVAEIEGL